MGKLTATDAAAWAAASSKQEAPSREIRTINTPRRKWKDGRTRPEHLWIPDTQVKAGVRIEHIRWAAEYALDKRPDVILTGNDWWDFPSLNSHEVEWADFRTRDLADDVLSGLHAWDLFIGTIRRVKDYHPTIVFIEGNHDQRFRRQYRYDVRTKRCLRGPRSFVKDTPGVLWLPLEEVACIDGVHYSHYFVSNVGRPLGGTSLHKLNKLKFSYTMGHQQGLDSSSQHLANGRVLRGLVAGCLTPDHKVLTADLRYVPIGDIEVGQKLVSFDENDGDSTGRSRRFKTGTVTNLARDIAEVFEVRLESGKTFKVTKDHVWLTKNSNHVYKWQTTDKLRVGSTSIPRVLPEWETLRTYEAGWLAGMFDGEGHLYARKTTGGSVMQLGVSQKQGPTLERLKVEIAAVCGEDQTTNHVQNGVMSMRIKGGVRNVAKVLGQIRPGRLLSKFRPELLGTMTAARGVLELDRVVSVSSLGRMEIVRSLVDCGTLVVEGYPHHNSFYQHDEEYRGAMGNVSHWRGLIYKHEVREGTYDMMEVSMDYLRRVYGGKPVVADKNWRADEFTVESDE